MVKDFENRSAFGELPDTSVGTFLTLIGQRPGLCDTVYIRVLVCVTVCARVRRRMWVTSRCEKD